MKLDDANTKTKMMIRLRRIEGQLRGVQEMVQSERDCREILQQLSAVRSAVQSATLSFAQDAISATLEAEDQPQKREELVQDLMFLLSKAP